MFLWSAPSGGAGQKHVGGLSLGTIGYQGLVSYWMTFSSLWGPISGRCPYSLPVFDALHLLSLPAVAPPTQRMAHAQSAFNPTPEAIVVQGRDRRAHCPSLPTSPQRAYDRDLLVRPVPPTPAGKGPVINWGEGEATKWGNRGSDTFCAPSSQDRVKLVTPPPPPPVKTVKRCAPPPLSAWLKFQVPVLKTPLNILPPPHPTPPFDMTKTFFRPPFS